MSRDVRWLTCFRVAVLGAVLSIGAGCASNIAPELRLPETASARPSAPVVTPVRWQLDNGLTVLYLQDPELPMMRGTLYLRTGTLWDNSPAVGSLIALGEEMRNGGAGRWDADALDSELERLSAGVSSSFGAEFGNVSFSCLSPDLATVLPIFSAVIREPRFDQKRLELWQTQQLEGIRRRVDTANSVASVALQQLVYGSGPYGKVALSRDITAIDRNTLIKLHQKSVFPDGAILALVGDQPVEQVRALVSRQLGDWKAAGVRLQPYPDPGPVAAPGIYFVELPFVQATVYAAEQSVGRLTPDYPAIELFNEAFGAGGFGSLLMKRIRADLGLAYSIYGSILPGPGRGKNLIAFQTKGSTAGQAIRESLAVLVGMQQEPVAKSWLAEMQRSTRNSFVFKFDEIDKALNRVVLKEILGYPIDYDSTYVDLINQVTPADVQTVAKARWHTDQLVIVVVGDKSAYDSLNAELASSNAGPLRGYTLRKVKFDEKLVL